MATARMRGRQSPHYRRRKPVPAIIVIALLAVASFFVWSKVFNTTQDVEAKTSCNAPTPATSSLAPPPGAPGVQPAPGGNDVPVSPAGQAMSRDALDRTDPVPASMTRVHVLNGTTARGQAGLVAEELGELGFQQAGDPTNDPVYPNSDLGCSGQIRFGPNGAGAARTLSLIIPCAQLVRDQRQDNTVDLSLGKKFDGVKPTTDARAALKQLDDWAQRQPAQHGGQQAQGNAPTVDNQLLANARNVECP